MARKDIPDILGQERQRMTVLDDVLSGKPGKATQVAIGSIRIDGGTQMRAALDDATVFEYTQAMAAADGWGTFPPVVAYYDGADYWLGDGFHRVAAFRDAFTDSTRKIPVDVRAGTRRDAILHAAGANANHGLRRTNADKRRSVETLLRDEEWALWTDREIARQCNVDHKTVASLRSSLGNSPVTERTYTTKHGTVATMQTANIGSSQPQRATYESSVLALNVVPSAATGSRQQGAQLATCRICHRPLSDPASAVAGVGPCCAAKRTTAAGSGEPEEDDDQPLNLATVDDDDELDILMPDGKDNTAAGLPVSMRPDYDSNEWYTPAEYIEAARAVMGTIELDPATCELAQTVVQANEYLTKFEDGLAAQWLRERVWLNPPYGETDPWIKKLLAEFDDGKSVKQAIVLVNNATETVWFQSLLNRFPVCFLNRRIPFWRHDQEGVTARQGQAIFYLGANTDRFIEVFRELGPILQRVS
jgi:phage N-6-adenine-methyltransferase